MKKKRVKSMIYSKVKETYTKGAEIETQDEVSYMYEPPLKKGDVIIIV